MRRMWSRVHRIVVRCSFLAVALLMPCRGKGMQPRDGADLPASIKAKIPPCIFVRRKAGYGLRGTNATMFSRRTEQGSSIEIYDPQCTNGPVRVLFSTEKGFVWDVDLSWDGTKILFTYKIDVNAPFHLWEIRVDGSGLRPLTDGPYHDFNGVYTPDGKIVFCSSRVEAYSYCQDFLASALYACNADGGAITRIDFTTLCSMKPSVMDDGTILFTRWEYQDKNIFMWQGLWTIQPDGRNMQLYYGNTVTIPNARYGGRQVPHTEDVLFTMAAHHHPPIGDIALLTRSKGIENCAAMRKVTFETPYELRVGKDWRDCNWGPGDRFYPDTVTDPCPIFDGLFLASVMTPSGSGKAFRLYACTYTGERYAVPVGDHVFSAIPLRVRALPATTRATLETQTQHEGLCYVQNVYNGLAEQGVTNGQVAALRIMRTLPKTYNTEGPRFHDHYPVMSYGTYYAKEIVGEVPVAADGSAYFQVPTQCELHFIALDRAGKEIQRMGSVFQVVSGETVACAGCHESRLRAPTVAAQTVLRANRIPDQPRAPSWGSGPIDYVRWVQPVFDQYCVRCHSGATPPKRVDLTGDKTRFFCLSYEVLCGRKWVDYFYINRGPTGVFPARQTGSFVSRLTQLIEEKHHDVDIDEESRRRIYAWIDSNVIYYPSFDMSRPHTVGGRDPWTCLNEKGKLVHEAWFDELNQVYKESCISCHQPLDEDEGWRKWTPALEWINHTHPENSRLLTAHLTKEEGGYGLAAKKEQQPEMPLLTKQHATYQRLLAALQKGHRALLDKPRMDMTNSVAVPQKREFGRTF